MNPAVHTPVTHPYLDARLEAIELRMDARVQRIEDKMDLFAQSMQQMQQSIKEVRVETHDAIATLKGDTQNAVERLQADTKSLKNTVLMTGISSVVAIVLGVAAFNATVLGNMVASFEAGSGSAQLLAHMQAQQEKHDKKMEEIVQRIEQQSLGIPQ